MSKKETQSVSERVQKTKREIENLKAEIQQLAEKEFKRPNLAVFDTLNLFKFDKENVEAQPELPPRKSPAKLTLQAECPSKKTPAKLTLQAKRPPKKSPARLAPPKKTVTYKKSPEPPRDAGIHNIAFCKKDKHYNVEEAREYIKRQREKRAEQLKSAVKPNVNVTDLKKEKLKELHKKSLELVQKNLQTTRERSKSRERGVTVRPDKTSPSPRMNRRKNEVMAVSGRVENRSRPQTRSVSSTTTNQFLQPPVIVQDCEIFEKTVEKTDETHQNFCPINRSELAIMTDACEKDTKETQTVVKSKFEEPHWLQVPQIQAYPYNFINTVKKKLQCAVKGSKNYTDVSVQNLSTLNTPEPEKQKSREEIKEILLKSAQSEVKSFASHHKASLDLTNVESLGLKSPIKNNMTSKQLLFEHSLENSESDTSKNIPEISSESVEVSKGAHLDLERVKRLKLKPHNLLDKINGSLSSRKSVSDFNNESIAYSSDFVIENEPKSSSTAIETITSNKNNNSSHFNSQDLSQSLKSSTQNNKSRSTEKNFMSQVIESILLKEPSSVKSFKNLLSNTAIEEEENITNSNKDSNLVEISASLKQHSESGTIQTKNNVSNGESQADRRISGGKSPAFESLKTNSQISPMISRISGQMASLKQHSESGTIQTKNNVSNSESQAVRRISGENSHAFESLKTNSQISPTISRISGQKSGGEDLQTLDQISPTISTEVPKYSENVVEDLALKEPAVSLSLRNNFNLSGDRMKNITIRPSDDENNNINSNEIHLKFEAEVRLIDDYHQQVKRLINVEQEYENLKNRSVNKIFQNADTQTSMRSSVASDGSGKSRINSFVNFSRGSDVDTNFEGSTWKIRDHLGDDLNPKSSSLNLEMNSFAETTTDSMDASGLELSLANIENFNGNPCAGWSLNMFEHLIKDEDRRIQHLKAIIKIREQALLDRTRTELVFLDIKRKELLEAGRREEASLIRKKQRGVILKGEQERNEIKKLKQVQQNSFKERKIFLQKQRNLIKSGLSTSNMMSKIKVSTPRERKSSGPLRVVQSCSESIRSETYSRKSSAGDEVLSVVSHSRSLRTSEEMESDAREESLIRNWVPVADLKRTLLVRESALRKRRRTTEELMLWHKKLLDEEKKIRDLEAAVFTTIKRQPPPQVPEERHEFTGKQLNQLWRTMTRREERKYSEDKIYNMSEVSLERFYKSATQFSTRGNKNSAQSVVSVSNSNKTVDSNANNYSSFFEQESEEDQKKISELIDNFSKIGDEIELLSKKSERDISSLEQTEESAEEASSHASRAEETLVEVEESSESSIGTESLKIQHTEELTGLQSEELITSIVASQSKDEPKTDQIEEIIPQVVTEEESLINDKTSEITEMIPHSNEEVSSAKEEIKEDSEPCSIIQNKTLSLDDALQAASNIEESLSKLNQQLVDREEDETTSITNKSKLSEDIISEFSVDSDKINSELKTPTVAIEDYKSQEVSTEVSSEKINSELKTPTVAIEDYKSQEVSTEVSSEKINEETSEKTTESGLEEKLSDGFVSEKEPEEKVTSEVPQLDSEGKASGDSSVSTEIPTESPKSTFDENSLRKIDVKKRVSEILADANGHNNRDKSPRLQDLYITAYDVGGPATPDLILKSPEEIGKPLTTKIFDNEAEELWKKQMAIEQEIKQLEQQQKEQLPYVLMREIPNKPPPPYTPPSSLTITQPTLLPTDQKEINEITNYSSKIIFKAYQKDTLDKIKFSENSFKLCSNVEVPKICGEFLFNICRELAKEHYKQFEEVKEPSWLRIQNKPQLVILKPLDTVGLERFLNRKLKEMFGFKKVRTNESAIIKWGRKKRDHVDEILVVESQEEECGWINFDKDEVMVKDQVTCEIMKSLLDESVDVFSKILSKKKYLY